MRLNPTRRSDNLEDRRAGGGGFGGGFGGGGRGLGLGGLVVLLVLSFVFRTDLVSLAGGGVGGGAVPSAGPVAPLDDPAEEKDVLFVSAVLDSSQSYWAQVMQGYQPAKLVLFRDAVQSACGTAQAASGPFYCPGDQKVYVDLGFYEQLKSQFGAPGDAAQAYVLAHEIGHHVQTLIGTSQQVSRLQQTRPEMANRASVLLELQADCYAGMWVHHADQQGVLDEGDVEEGLRAAAAVGDDRIQRMQGQAVSPESFTHGSSEERMAWFRRGFQSSDPKQCDTFSRAN
jgi:predicted metalloprotease